MQSFSRSTLRLWRRPPRRLSHHPLPDLFSLSPPILSITTVPPRWWPPVLTRRDALPIAASAPLNKSRDLVSRYGSRNVASSAGVESQKEGDAARATKEITDSEKGAEDISDGEEGAEIIDDKKNVRMPTMDDVIFAIILDNSSHRDGSIYKDICGWKQDYCITNRDENAKFTTFAAASPVPASSSGLRTLDLLDTGELAPTPPLYHSLITACAQSKNLNDARTIHAHLASSQFAGDAFLDNSLIHMYCKCSSVVDARKVFDEMPTRDMVSWTSLIAGYAQNDMPVEAIGLLPRMLRGRFKLNGFTFASLLKAAGAYAGRGIGEQIHALAVKCDWHENVYVGSALLDMYARCGQMDMATAVFDKLDSKNGVSWNALIAGFARKGDGETALMTFAEMQRNGFGATHFTYSSLFTAIAGIGALEQGKWVHAHMIKCGQKLTAFVGNTILDMYAKSGSLIDARKVFDHMDKKDLVTWNSMLTAFAQYGLGKEAIIHFEEMRKCGIHLNQITLLSILTACSHGGLVKEGKHYFDMMKEYNLEPEIEHYVTVVDLLGRAGLLNDALVFIFKMPMKPTAAVWGALLGACRMHKNAKVGQFAADHVFELDPDDTGPPVLLYNIYASTGQWDDAATVRKMMKATGVKKEPACSWVEIENSVHMFVANDDTHLRAEEIHKMWDEIDMSIRKAGYVPNTDYVLLHADEQEREAKLQYHSEKIALAFALINMPAGATIRIMKNIRICGDCHSAFKYVSNVFERDIVVRDTNRFHHFSNGSCSCGDYW